MDVLKDPFKLFCLYYLGVTPEGTFRFVNGNQIAKQFNITVQDLMGYLSKAGMHPDVVLNTDFPMARHQVDVQLAADELTGEGLLHMAREVYDAFHGRLGKKRDWLAEIAREKSQDV